MGRAAMDGEAYADFLDGFTATPGRDGPTYRARQWCLNGVARIIVLWQACRIVRWREYGDPGYAYLVRSARVQPPL